MIRRKVPLPPPPPPKPETGSYTCPTCKGLIRSIKRGGLRTAKEVHGESCPGRRKKPA